MSDHARVDETEFKAAMRQVTSSVAVVTASFGNLRNGLTATSVCSVTMEPPTMLVCVNRKARADALIAESRAFAINILADAQHKTPPTTWTEPSLLDDLARVASLGVDEVIWDLNIIGTAPDVQIAAFERLAEALGH